MTRRYLRLIATALALLAFSVPSFAQDKPPPLIRLPDKATAPTLAFQRGKLGPTGRETRLGGWLVLNGARFRNSEYPELAKLLTETYAQQGFKSPDPDFTPLQNWPSETDSHGEIVRGVAICPSRSLCGDLVGQMSEFDLNSSL